MAGISLSEDWGVTVPRLRTVILTPTLGRSSIACLLGRVFILITKAVFVNFTIEGSFTDPEDFSGFSPIPLNDLQGVSNQLTFELLDRRTDREPSRSSTHSIGSYLTGKILNLENLSGTGDDHVLDGILQLSDISGPRIPGENPKGIP